LAKNSDFLKVGTIQNNALYVTQFENVYKDCISVRKGDKILRKK